MHTIKHDKQDNEWTVLFHGNNCDRLIETFDDPEPAAAMASYLNGGQKPGRKSIPTPVLKAELKQRGFEVFERVAPLTEPVGPGEYYWLADEDRDTSLVTWSNDELDHQWLSQGRCYPFNKNGKLSASLHES